MIVHVPTCDHLADYLVTIVPILYPNYESLVN